MTHPNECRVYGIAQGEGLHFISMEFVEGEALAVLAFYGFRASLGRRPLIETAD